jgi:hypothetical protein
MLRTMHADKCSGLATCSCLHKALHAAAENMMTMKPCCYNAVIHPLLHSTHAFIRHVPSQKGQVRKVLTISLYEVLFVEIAYQQLAMLLHLWDRFPPPSLPRSCQQNQHEPEM